MNFKKALSAFLAFSIFTTQVALGSIAESNFWQDRRIKSVGAPSLSSLPALSPASPSKPPSFKSLMEAIPSSLAIIRDAYQPPQNPAPPLLIIQDVHLNPEAQRAIAALMQRLANENKIGAIGVEGAFAPFEFDQFRSFDDKAAVRRISDKLLNEGRMGAASYVGINSRNEPSVLGVDDRNHYEKNKAAYLASKDRQPLLEKEFKARSLRLIEEKSRLLNPELRKFDADRCAYNQGDLGLAAYLKGFESPQAKLPVSVKTFLKAHALEKSLDFSAVDRERRRIVEKLTSRLNRAEMDAFIHRTMAYRSGATGFADYYAEIESLCARQRIDLAAVPAFRSYLRYIRLSNQINADNLFSEIETMETARVERLATTKSEKNLIRESELLHLAQKLIRFELTPPEWTAYKKKNREKPFDLSSFESFYEEADIRSQKLSQQILSLPHHRSNVLLTGGFHTKELTELLKKAGRSYVVAAPRLTRAPDAPGSAYLTAFAQEKTPLDRLFAGEKLFILPSRVLPGSADGDNLMTLTLFAAETGRGSALTKTTVEEEGGHLNVSASFDGKSSLVEAAREPRPGAEERAGWWLSTPRDTFEFVPGNWAILWSWMLRFLHFRIVFGIGAAIESHFIFKLMMAAYPSVFWLTILFISWPLFNLFVMHPLGMFRKTKTGYERISIWDRRVTLEIFMNRTMIASFVPSFSALIGILIHVFGGPFWLVVTIFYAPHILSGIFEPEFRTIMNAPHLRESWRRAIAGLIYWRHEERIRFYEESGRSAEQLKDLDLMTNLPVPTEDDPDMQAFLRSRTRMALMLDVNNAGKINEHHPAGEQAGNNIIFQLATDMEEAIQHVMDEYAKDGFEFRLKLYRKGGDEFLVCLWDVNNIHIESRAVAEELLKEIKKRTGVYLVTESKSASDKKEVFPVFISGSVNASIEGADQGLADVKKNEKESLVAHIKQLIGVAGINITPDNDYEKAFADLLLKIKAATEGKGVDALKEKIFSTVAFRRLMAQFKIARLLPDIKKPTPEDDEEKIAASFTPQESSAGRILRKIAEWIHPEVKKDAYKFHVKRNEALRSRWTEQGRVGNRFALEAASVKAEKNPRIAFVVFSLPNFAMSNKFGEGRHYLGDIILTVVRSAIYDVMKRRETARGFRRNGSKFVLLVLEEEAESYLDEVTSTVNAALEKKFSPNAEIEATNAEGTKVWGWTPDQKQASSFRLFIVGAIARRPDLELSDNGHEPKVIRTKFEKANDAVKKIVEATAWQPDLAGHPELDSTPASGEQRAVAPKGPSSSPGTWFITYMAAWTFDLLWSWVAGKPRKNRSDLIESAILDWAPWFEYIASVSIGAIFTGLLIWNFPDHSLWLALVKGLIFTAAVYSLGHLSGRAVRSDKRIRFSWSFRGKLKRLLFDLLQWFWQALWQFAPGYLLVSAFYLSNFNVFLALPILLFLIPASAWAVRLHRTRNFLFLYFFPLENQSSLGVATVFARLLNGLSLLSEKKTNPSFLQSIGRRLIGGFLPFQASIEKKISNFYIAEAIAYLDDDRWTSRETASALLLFLVRDPHTAASVFSVGQLWMLIERHASGSEREIIPTLIDKESPKRIAEILSLIIFVYQNDTLRFEETLTSLIREIHTIAEALDNVNFFAMLPENTTDEYPNAKAMVNDLFLKTQGTSLDFLWEELVFLITAATELQPDASERAEFALNFLMPLSKKIETLRRYAETAGLKIEKFKGPPGVSFFLTSLSNHLAIKTFEADGFVLTGSTRGILRRAAGRLNQLLKSAGLGMHQLVEELKSGRYRMHKTIGERLEKHSIGTWVLTYWLAWAAIALTALVTNKTRPSNQIILERAALNWAPWFEYFVSVAAGLAAVTTIGAYFPGHPRWVLFLGGFVTTLAAYALPHKLAWIDTRDSIPSFRWFFMKRTNRPISLRTYIAEAFLMFGPSYAIPAALFLWNPSGWMFFFALTMGMIFLVVAAWIGIRLHQSRNWETLFFLYFRNDKIKKADAFLRVLGAINDISDRMEEHGPFRRRIRQWTAPIDPFFLNLKIGLASLVSLAVSAVGDDDSAYSNAAVQSLLAILRAPYLSADVFSREDLRTMIEKVFPALFNQTYIAQNENIRSVLTEWMNKETAPQRLIDAMALLLADYQDKIIQLQERKKELSRQTRLLLEAIQQTREQSQTTDELNFDALVYTVNSALNSLQDAPPNHVAEILDLAHVELQPFLTALNGPNTFLINLLYSSVAQSAINLIYIRHHLEGAAERLAGPSFSSDIIGFLHALFRASLSKSPTVSYHVGVAAARVNKSLKANAEKWRGNFTLMPLAPTGRYSISPSYGYEMESNLARTLKPGTSVLALAAAGAGDQSAEWAVSVAHRIDTPLTLLVFTIMDLLFVRAGTGAAGVLLAVLIAVSFYVFIHAVRATVNETGKLEVKGIWEDGLFSNMDFYLGQSLRFHGLYFAAFGILSLFSIPAALFAAILFGTAAVERHQENNKAASRLVVLSLTGDGSLDIEGSLQRRRNEMAGSLFDHFRAETQTDVLTTVITEGKTAGNVREELREMRNDLSNEQDVVIRYTVVAETRLIPALSKDAVFKRALADGRLIFVPHQKDLGLAAIEGETERRLKAHPATRDIAGQIMTDSLRRLVLPENFRVPAAFAAGSNLSRYRVYVEILRAMTTIAVEVDNNNLNDAERLKAVRKALEAA